MKKLILPKLLKAGDLIIFMKKEKRIKSISQCDDSSDNFKRYEIHFDNEQNSVVVPANLLFELVIEKMKKKKGLS